jgi:hypothetical protein
VLFDQAPSGIRRLLADLFETYRTHSTALPAEATADAFQLAKELITEAWDHGSDAATLRIGIDDGVVVVEVFDGPRRSALGMSGNEEGVPELRKAVESRLADDWSSRHLSDGHFVRCAIRYS